VRLAKSQPVKLTTAQEKQLKLIKQKTGVSASAVLRLSAAVFLEKFGDKPEEVLKLYAEYHNKGAMTAGGALNQPLGGEGGGKVKPRPKKHVNSSEDAAASPIERSVLAAIEREGKRAARER
jgi:hypothetical protein